MLEFKTQLFIIIAVVLLIFFAAVCYKKFISILTGNTATISDEDLVRLNLIIPDNTDESPSNEGKTESSEDNDVADSAVGEADGNYAKNAEPVQPPVKRKLPSEPKPDFNKINRPNNTVESTADGADGNYEKNAEPVQPPVKRKLPSGPKPGEKINVDDKTPVPPKTPTVPIERRTSKN